MRLRGPQGASGQATVEAAFALPLVLALVLLLVQPAILLYDRMVMQGAAAEACRLLATASDSSGQEVCEDFVRRRLGAVPEQDNFHVHSAGCSWEIHLDGGEGSDEARVAISTEVRPLPLIGAGARLLGAVNDGDNFVVSVEACSPTQPAWVGDSAESASPSDWVGAWL